MRDDLFPRDLATTLVTDFFGGVAQVELVDTPPSFSSSISSSPAKEALLDEQEDEVETYEVISLAGNGEETDQKGSLGGRSGGLWAAVTALGALAGWSYMSASCS